MMLETAKISFRLFVLDRVVVTHSPYLRQGQLAQTQDGDWIATEAERGAALDFAARVLGDSAVHLPPAVALDVGTIEGRGWAIVEANAAWGSGIYGCDASAVLKVVQRACVRQHALRPEDIPWLLHRK